MRSIFLSFTAAFILLTLSGFARDWDWGNLTDADIAELRAQRHAFYKAESAGKQEAILAGLLDEGIKRNLNQDNYDVRYYGVHLDLNFTAESIEAWVDYRIASVVSGLSSVDLNLVDQLNVDSVRVAGQVAAYSHLSDLLTITLPQSYNSGQQFEMQVFYHGVPYYDGAAGMIYTWDLGYQMCWTKATPYRSRYWWPCKDYPRDKADSLDLYVEMPDNYDLATNGVQVSSTPAGSGRKVIHYKHNYPINTYAVALCCSQYQIDEQTWNYDSYSMPLFSYALPNNAEAFTSFQFYGPQALTILSDLYGVYPFVNEKMGNADFGWTGAMEHQTCCMYATDFHDEWIIAHETGHQWWGDMITCHTFNHIWLNEGFASYTEALYFEVTQGEAAYFDYVQSQKFLGPGSIYVENLVYEEIYDGSLSYDKASWVLHMLRGVVGDSLFFQILHDYGYSEHRYGTATTQDFIDVASATLGEDIGWFVNEWIYGEGNPQYELSWQCIPSETRSGYDLTYVVQQVQTYGTYFRMPVRTTIHTTGGDLDTVLWDEGALQIYGMNFADSVTSITFDPQQWILRTNVNVVPFTMHIATVVLPGAVEGEPYSQTLNVVGGVPPYTWQKIGGDLPLGLYFDAASATIYGTPTWPANYYFSIRVTDSGTPLLQDTRNYTLRVTEPEPDPDCGDANGDSLVNITDAVFLIDYIFNNGAAPEPLSVGDVNCDGLTNITDAVYLIQYIFASGPVPCADCL